MIDLAAMRRTVGVTQVEMAARLGMTQSGVSQLERRGDVLLSTLAAYLAALGADVAFTVTIGDQTFEHDLTRGKR